MPVACTERNRCLHQREDQVQIVNHQIEHDADVGGAPGERPGPVAADHLGLQRPADDLFVGGIGIARCGRPG